MADMADMANRTADRITVVLFAVHHASSNIASQRFRSLMKYLDSGDYRIHVLTRSPEDGLPLKPAPETANLSVHLLGGHCVGRSGSLPVTLLVFLSAFFAKLPFAVRWLSDRAGLRSSWMINALACADTICREALARGERCFIIGTYSTVDALVASNALAAHYGLPYQQDFRDGFVFETLGRKGRFASWLRSVIERRVVQQATLVTSVSSTIVDDFRRRYPQLTVELLPNGFDPAEFSTPSQGESSSAARAILDTIARGRVAMGHFGRVSASDHSSLPAFQRLVEILKTNPQLLEKVHLLFVGKLTATEEALLAGVDCSKTVLPTVDRPVAQELMGHCDLLLLITGDRVSVASGKLFEYLATGRQILCFTAVRNEATKILDATRAGTTILADDPNAAAALFKAVTELQQENSALPQNVSAYDRRSQAALLSAWIKKACQ